MPVVEQDISRGGVLSAGQGRSLWFQGNLMTIKVAGEHTDDAVAVVEGTFRAGHGPPLHVHRNEDELFYILDGQMLVACDGRTSPHGPAIWSFCREASPTRSRSLPTAGPHGRSSSSRRPTS
jgi:hypothetical protein